jgi:HEAT repeat protein
VSSDLRIAAAEALANSPGDPTALLMKYAADPDPEVRMAAGFALASTEESDPVAGELINLTEKEKDPQVRAKFYQALENQSDVDFAKAFLLVKNETDFGAKLAGLNLLAEVGKTNPEISNYFTETGLSELKNAALNGRTLHDRLSATLTLRKLGSPDSVTALRELSQQASDPKVVQAATSALGQQPQ